MLTITYSFTGQSAVTLSVAETASAAQQTAAIQSALDAVAGHPGGTVSLSAGTFTVAGTGIASDGALRVGSNTTFEGAGAGLTTLKLADGSSTVTGIVRTDSGSTLPDGSIKTTEHVLIRDLTIDGNRANTTGDVDGFYCGPKPNSAAADIDIALANVEIKEVSRYGFNPHEQTIGLSITNSTAHHNSMDGFTVDFSTNVTLTGNTAYANGRHGFNIVTSSSNVTMTGNEAYGNGGSGISVQTGDNEARAFTSDVTIIGGSVHDNGRAGIEVKQSTDIVISGVTVAGNTQGNIILRGVENATLTNNTISGPGLPVRIEGYVQTFGDADPLNDRFVASHNIVVDGVAQPDVTNAGPVPTWSWSITAGDDLLIGGLGGDRIAAGAGNDTVDGAGGDDLLLGCDGADSLAGGTGVDTLMGGAGTDVLRLDTGGDLLDGGAGFDTADASGLSAGVRIDLALPGNNAWLGAAAIGRLLNVEAVTGTQFGDQISGSNAANLLSGGGGADRLTGAGGADTLSGGAGNDTLNGGSGNDRFAFVAGWGTDTIQDFARGKDKIDLSAAGVTSMAQLTIVTVAGSADIALGADHIVLTGVAAGKLTAADFVFA